MENKLFLYITQDCNLRCKYCFVKKNKKVISEKTLKDSIDFFVKLCQSKGENAIIYLFGGEPLLHPDKVKLATDHILKEYGGLVDSGAIRLYVLTNGLLLDDDIYSYLVDKAQKFNNNLCLGISIDGPVQSNDKNRSEGQRVLSKIKNISKDPPTNLKIGFIWTIHPNETQNTYQNFKFFFDEMKIGEFATHLSIILANSPGWEEQHRHLIRVETQKVAQYYISNTQKINKTKVYPFSDIQEGENAYLLNRCFSLLTKRCDFDKIVVFPDGEINACCLIEFTDGIEYNPSLIGNVSNITLEDYNKKMDYLRDKFNITEFIDKNKKYNDLKLSKTYHDSNKFCLAFLDLKELYNKSLVEKTYLDTIKKEFK